MASTISVRGMATVPARPDEVELSVEVSVLEQTPDAALSGASRDSEVLEQIFKELEIEDARRITSGISIGEEREHQRERWVHRGYRATNRIAVRLTDPSLVGRLMSEAIGRAHAQVHGPWWQIAPDNSARLEACRQAVTEARRKAEAYAEALGVRLGAVISVTEPGTGGREAEESRSYLRAPVHTVAHSEIRLHAGDLEVAALVDVTFSLETE